MTDEPTISEIRRQAKEERSGGIEGKWAALNDERETMRAERDQLRAQVAVLLAEKQAHEDAKQYGVGFNQEEGEAWEAVRFALNRIAIDWRLRANNSELAGAVHTIQSFIIMHMLSRLDGKRWGNWWETKSD